MRSVADDLGVTTGSNRCGVDGRFGRHDRPGAARRRPHIAATGRLGPCSPRQAIYLHFASKADLLTALFLQIYETDVVPALARHPIWTAPSALDALDAAVAVDAEVASKVWRIHEALVVARRHHPEVAETLRPREQQRCDELVGIGRWLKRDGDLPDGMRVATFADMFWGLASIGTFVNLVVERGWPVDRFARWVRETLRLHLASG